jgi:preprotein translocase subunit SecB
MSDDPKTAARLAAVAQIGDVRLYDASAKRRIRNPREIGDQAELSIARGARVTAPLADDGSFMVVAGVEAKVAPPDPKARPFVVVKVSFEISYRLPEGFAASAEELEEFAQVNAVFNVWPYCREFVQTTTARMGLPPIVLPLFHATDGAKEQKRTSASKNAKAAKA